MYISKTLAMPSLNETDFLKITRVNRIDEEDALLVVIKELIKHHTFDISDDELLLHICVHKGLFTYKAWQNIVNDRLIEASNIDYEVDPTKKRPNLVEDLYYMSGANGSISGEMYKMLLALSARKIIFDNEEKFKKAFGAPPREYIEVLWQRLIELCEEGMIEGKYTDELFRLKHS